MHRCERTGIPVDISPAREPTVTREERSWIFYDWANSAYSLAVTTTILPVFFKDVAAGGLANSTSYWGYANSIASLIVAVLAPILGAMADYEGRKKRLFSVFLLLGVSMTATLSFVGEGQWQFCLGIYILSTIGFAGANIFYDAFLPDVAEADRMDRVSSYGFAWGYIGSTIPFIVSILVIRKPGIVGLDSKLVATRTAFVITAVWWAVFSIPLLKNVRQVYFVAPSPQPIRDSLRRLGAIMREIRGHRNAFVFLIAYFFYIDGVHTIIKMAAVYGKDLNLKSETLMLVILVIQFVAFPCAIIYGELARIFSAKAMLFVGIVVYIFVTIFACFMSTALHFWILALLVGSSQGGVQALSRSFYGKLVPKEKAAEFFGFYNVFGRFAAILGPTLVGGFGMLTGRPRLGILSLIVLFIAGGAILLRVRRTPMPA